MIVRLVTTDDELETWTRVRNAVELDAPSTLEDVRTTRRRQPETRHWLAEEDGEAVGCAFAAGSTVPGRAFVLPRVPAEHRGRGIGGALVEATLIYVSELACDAARSHVDGRDEHSLRFAARRGFAEVDRQVELVRALHGDESACVPPAGIELVELAPEHGPELRVLLARGVADMPVAGGVDAGLAAELLEELEGASYAVSALDGDRLVGVAGLVRCGARVDALEHAFTAVLAPYRGRGVAKALKQSCVRWAAGRGYRELVTWTQKGNEAMQAVNERAGFRAGHVSITVERPLQALDAVGPTV